MTTQSDFLDFTNATSRLQQSLSGSPVVSSTAGVNTTTLTVDTWARSLTVLIPNAANVLTLSIVGTTSGFTYLNATPAYDGGIYYIPVLPVVDAQVTLTWYQIAIAPTVSIYVTESDEPISTTIFNPISPTISTSERDVYGLPQPCPANILTSVIVVPDVTTKALRCSVDNVNAELWGRIIGISGTVYFDGSATNTPFPTTPIAIDGLNEAHVTVFVQTTVALSCNLYISAINAPDFSGNIPITHPMAPNELAPDPKQSETPNQFPAIFDGSIAANGMQSLVGIVSGRQYRLFAISIMQYSGIATSINLEDTSGAIYFHYHYSAASNEVYVPLFGQITTRASGIQLHNLLASATATLAVTLWYSVL